MYMYKFFLIVIITVFSLSSCKKEKDDNNLFKLSLLYLLSQNVNFSAKFSNITASSNRNTKLLQEGITDVLAISSSNHYHRGKVDANGNFSLGLSKGYNYIFVFIDSKNNVKGYYKLTSLSLNTVPTIYSGNEINGGEIEKSSNDNSYSPIRNFNINEFKAQTGNLSDLEIDAMLTIGTQILQLSNIDSDGNGIIDLEENLYVRPFFSQGWGGDINDNRFLATNANNRFFDMSFFSNVNTGVGFGFALDKSRISDNNVKISYPVPQGCTGNSGLINTSFFTTDANLPTGKLLPATTSALQVYTNLGFCGNSPFVPEPGTYVIENSGKKFTFNNMTPFIIRADKTYVLPTVKFNTDGDRINSLEYKYIKLTPNGVLDATAREVALVYGISTFRSSGIICRDTALNSTASNPWLFSCFFPKDRVSGTITNCQSGNFVKLNNPNSANFSQIKNCNFYTYDDYGTYLGVNIFQ